MSPLHQDNGNHHMCHMSMLLKAKTHINTIGKVWVITPHGARQQFGILIFVHEITSAAPPDHLNPLLCLLSHMIWLRHPLLMLSAPYHAYAPAPPSKYVSMATPPPLLTMITLPLHPQDMPLMPTSPLCMLPPIHLILSATYHPYGHAVPSSHPYALAAPSRCDSNDATPSWPSPFLMLLHPALSSRPLTIVMLPQRPQDVPPMPPPHCHAHPSICLRTPPHFLFCLQSLYSFIRCIGYGGLLENIMNPITEIF
ncbi:hypothetical protein O181_013516 [Austropuccinia psidii MF-1]|uniref:Uncharacterized protein n=1 Tax=Austropuccinia psidii MF-1 TaxID=1389203 RepID=A0A9Q3GNA5_9BASI|nr:hypothetical protein [Austropuccinia psidii MF-1]